MATIATTSRSESQLAKPGGGGDRNKTWNLSITSHFSPSTHMSTPTSQQFQARTKKMKKDNSFGELRNFFFAPVHNCERELGSQRKATFPQDLITMATDNAPPSAESLKLGECYNGTPMVTHRSDNSKNNEKDISPLHRCICWWCWKLLCTFFCLLFVPPPW